MIKKTSLMAAICSQAKPPSNNHDDAQYLVGIERVIKRANSIYRLAHPPRHYSSITIY
ncbi:MAG: hypothetical protein P8O76_00230 [Methylophilaceae bacterium]|nr:hypothetical protein [Methylophilaceae bacterium]MDG1445739.1 hypothetical protein [Methylophilaceae bacterium]